MKNSDREAILEAARHGPFLVVGDVNTSVRYRREEERDVIGPYMYSPLPAALQTVADGAPAPITEPIPSNRTLLSEMCVRTQTVIAQTFLQKSQRQKVTFYAKSISER